MQQNRTRKSHFYHTIGVLIFALFVLTGKGIAPGKYENILPRSQLFPDQTPLGYLVQPTDQLFWETHDVGPSWNETGYIQWKITYITAEQLFASVSSWYEEEWDWWLNNQPVGSILMNGAGFTAHTDGPRVIPLPMNATCLVAGISGTWARFIQSENTTWMWDGQKLQIWDHTHYDIGDNLEDYYLEIGYNAQGIMLYWNESYHIGLDNYIFTILLKEYHSNYEIPVGMDYQITTQSVNQINTTILLGVSGLVNLSVASSLNPPLDTPVDRALVYLEVNSSDESKIIFPVNLVFEYTDAKLAEFGLTADKVAVWYLNSSNVWEQLKTLVNTEMHTITVTLTHFSYYALAPGIPQISTEINTSQTSQTDTISTKSIPGMAPFWIFIASWACISIIASRIRRRL